MERIIYHGSDNIVEKPQFGLGNKLNDYGLGFYCCSNKELAKEWASKRKGAGFVNRYRIRDDRLKILDLTKPPYNNVLYWVALLVHNRKLPEVLKDKHPVELEYLEKSYLIDISKYDVVIGYRADDSYFQFPESFIKGEITLKSLEQIFLSGDLGEQYVLISKRAFSNLHFLDFEETYEISRERYYLRKAKADGVYADLVKSDRYVKGIRLRDLAFNNE